MNPLDPRVTLARGGVAALALEGVQEATRYLTPEPMQAAFAVCAIRREPSRTAEQLDQLIFGERFDMLERQGGWAFGQALRDGYVGWVRLETLAPAGPPPTHWVSALRTYAFGEASIKADPVACLSMNALVRVEASDGRLARLDGSGYAPERHLRRLGDWAHDPAAVALAYLGAPYLWGGRDSVGLDCSGLVQQAFYACGQAAPRDSDQQALLGRAVDREALVRGDLVFWRGHVGMMLDAETLIHANAFHMAVTAEPLAAAVERVVGSDGGRPTDYRRLSPA
ncbi:NlpC/P60 family protein [Caulobacter sp. S45]|uniref:C40 family peptidase n=1 Tax=Caulobacter sp. S45 TaxID=1641861 RepID=UPI0020C73769|nr:NlpC/P60 family protein [Caulobacter sp. S45]